MKDSLGFAAFDESDATSQADSHSSSYAVYGPQDEDDAEHRLHLMGALKREATRQGRTMSDLVESALRLWLRSPCKRGHISPLPSFRSGGALVDVADRDALYAAM